MAHTRKASQSGIVPPTLVQPHYIGQVYYDTVANKSYLSKSKTVGDWFLLGLGNMTTAVYDINLNNIVDSSEQLDDGAGNIVTSAEIRNHLDNLPVFGNDFQYSENLGVSVSTSTAFLNKLDFTTTSLPAGLYKVEWSYGWNHDRTRDDFIAQIAIDDDFATNNLVMIHRQEPKDSSGLGSGRYISTATNQNFISSGFRILNLSGVHNFKLRYRTSKKGVESSIWDATITIHRVS